MKKKITILPGDGIGPEVVNNAIKVIRKINQRFGHDFSLSYASIGAQSIDEFGIPLHESTIEQCLSSDAVLLGAIGDPKYDNNPDAKIRPEQGLLQLRKALGLHTNVRPIQSFAQTMSASPLKKEIILDVDMVIYRELTGGLYFGEKRLSDDGTIATDLCSYSVMEIERIAKNAFEMAQIRRKKLTLVDKANVLETSRLWRKVIQQLQNSYPDVEVDFLFVDNAAMQIMLNPRQFDVILTENLFGDILSDLAGVITGSIGMLPSSSIGDATALFEPVHGSYPQAAGKDIANPVGTILSVAMMYDHFGLLKEANVIRDAVKWTTAEGIVTKDINSKECCWASIVSDFICYYIEDSDLPNKDSNRFHKKFMTII